MSDTNTNEQPKWLNKGPEPEQLEVDARGNWVYPEQLSQGYEQVEIPSLGGVTPTETLLLRDLGGHISNKIESAMSTSYLSKHSPAQVMQHYTSMIRELKLMDANALKRLEGIADEFEREPEREEYFKQVIRPYLHSLAPKRR